MRFRIIVVLAVVAALLPLLGGGEEAKALGPCFGEAPTIVIAAPGLVTNGTSGDDVIMGTTGVDVIDGRGGNDRICSGLGGDEVHGGKGADQISTSDGNDRVFGDGGNDYIDGGAGDDTISGWTGKDKLYGGDGNDELWGGGNDDKLYGEEGNDTLLFSTGTDKLNGGGGKDWFEASGVTKSRVLTGLRIDLASGTYSGAVGGDGTITKVENVRGTGKDDHIIGAPLVVNRLEGGDGDDRVEAATSGDTVLGGAGNDTLIGSTWFISLFGQAGNDRITATARGEAAGGFGTDKCTLGPGSTSEKCERHILICDGPGDPLPATATSLTTATGDFDGNGTDGTLQVYRDGGSWYIRLLTDRGHGAAKLLPTGGAEAARAIGGHDINKDGVDEAFVVTGQGATTELVTLYTMQEPIEAPPNMRCGVGNVYIGPGTTEATFPVGASVGNQSGLVCLANGVREINQSTADGTTYTQGRSTYSYDPTFGQSNGRLTFLAKKSSTLTRPGDDAAIDAAGTLQCGSLSL
ncbi:MAG: hypothetical protein KJ698_10565 [Actinobacteria bacterium]|nr:hypothetical protein [Actinomycetota bacterium]MBU1493031.1 hypothetical protein [Actinomycetota bacterium]MBU1866729.1 hypothetical protein [Actinomycetota bacterium]